MTLQITRSYQHAIATDASRQASRDCAWSRLDDDELDDDEPLVLSRKQLKRNAWHKAATYAREARRKYAISYLRAYKRHRSHRVRHAS